MQKIEMARGVTLAFEEGYEKYLEYCRQRNLREGTTERKTDRSITAQYNLWNHVLDFCGNI